MISVGITSTVATPVKRIPFHSTGWDNGLAPNTFRNTMMTSSNGNIFRVTGPLCGEFTGPGEFPTQRPVTRSFDVFFDLRLNKRLSKQPWGWWFETPSWSLWRQCNALPAGHGWGIFSYLDVNGNVLQGWYIFTYSFECLTYFYVCKE